MTDDPVALSQWYPVADSGQSPVPPAYTTSLLGHPARISFAGDRARITALSPDGHELRELPVTDRFGLIWATLGTPASEVYDFPEAHEPGRRHLRCGWVTLRTSAPRIVENFLGQADGQSEIRFGGYEAGAAGPAGGAALTYRVPSPFQAVLYRASLTAPGRLDAILLAVHPLDEHRCRAQLVEYLIDDRTADNDLTGREQAIFLRDRFILENQRPLSLPLSPGAEVSVAADAASLAYRGWLRDKNLTFGVLT
jgi:phenylpropionate dioxygenase-like ring-hydroxylating dioxygenase large terminal subunit